MSDAPRSNNPDRLMVGIVTIHTTRHKTLKKIDTWQLVCEHQHDVCLFFSRSLSPYPAWNYTQLLIPGWNICFADSWRTYSEWLLERSVFVDHRKMRRYERRCTKFANNMPDISSMTIRMFSGKFKYNFLV